MGFLDPNTDFRWILPTETDANSPLSEELLSQVRENIESNTMNRIYSGYRAQVVSRIDGTNLEIEKIDDADPDWPTDIAATLILAFRSGAALGQDFEITANTELLDSPDTATVTIAGTPDFPTSILAGDQVLVMYAQTGVAHTHDGIDSAPVGGEKLVGTYDGTFVGPSSLVNGGTYYLFSNYVGTGDLGDTQTYFSYDASYKGLRARFTLTQTGGWTTWNSDIELWLSIHKPGAVTNLYNIDSTGSLVTFPFTSSIDQSNTVTIARDTIRSVGTNNYDVVVDLPLWDITGLTGTLVDGFQYPISLAMDVSLASTTGTNFSFSQFRVYSTTTLV